MLESKNSLHTHASFRSSICLREAARVTKKVNCHNSCEVFSDMSKCAPFLLPIVISLFSLLWIKPRASCPVYYTVKRTSSHRINSRPILRSKNWLRNFDLRGLKFVAISWCCYVPIFLSSLHKSMSKLSTVFSPSLMVVWRCTCTQESRWRCRAHYLPIRTRILFD